MADRKPLSMLTGLIQKYKHAALVVLIGLGLMLLPTADSQETPAQPAQESQPAKSSDLESRLSRLLSRIRGAGEVEVLLTIRTGGETLYQTDEDLDPGESGTRKTSSTVIVEDSSNQELGLVRRTDPPVYQGAVAICQGADDPKVKLAIVEAISCVTGLGADQITVVKMK